MKRKNILFFLGTFILFSYLYHVIKISLITYERKKTQEELVNKFRSALLKARNDKKIKFHQKNLEKENNLLINKTIKNTKKEKIRKLPEVILIGASKSGTRALINYLGLHPSIAIASQEINFFDENYHRGFEWYR
jgi:hypothetical protein